MLMTYHVERKLNFTFSNYVTVFCEYYLFYSICLVFAFNCNPYVLFCAFTKLKKLVENSFTRVHLRYLTRFHQYLKCITLKRLGKGGGGVYIVLKISFPQKLEMFVVCTRGKIEFVFFYWIGGNIWLEGGNN